MRVVDTFNPDMQEHNPYAPPAARLSETPNTSGCRRDGKILVVPRGQNLPPHCLKCGELIKKSIKPKIYYWHNPALALLILVGLIIYLIVALIVRKSITVSPGLCEEHSKRRNKITLLWLGAFGLSVVSAFMAANLESGGISLFLSLVAFIAFIAAFFSRRIIYPVEITEKYARFKGAGESFLDKL